jgi:hypothetical protein
VDPRRGPSRFLGLTVVIALVAIFLAGERAQPGTTGLAPTTGVIAQRHADVDAQLAAPERPGTSATTWTRNRVSDAQVAAAVVALLVVLGALGLGDVRRRHRAELVRSGIGARRRAPSRAPPTLRLV